jgi:hypothetical protein
MKASRVFNRGVIIAPPIQQDGTTIKLRGDPTQRLARFAALYFDKAIFTDNNIISVGLDNDSQELINVGFAKIHKYQVNSIYDSKVDGIKSIPEAVIDDTFISLPSSQRQKWSVLDDNNSYSGVSDQQGQYSSIFIDIFSKFPCPDNQTPIKEIIKFNSAHRATLHNLRLGISQLAERMALAKNTSDIAHAISVEIDTHLEILDTQLTKTGFQSFKESLTIGLQMPSSLIATIFSIAGVPFGIAAPLSNLLSISAGNNPYKSRFQSVDWAYILSAQKKRIV